jgi:hypothetical protein
VASRANDGNTDGNYNNGSVSHTAAQAQPYWDLDLGAGNAAQTLDRINVWNRTDGGGPSRTVNFHVFVSDNPFTGTTVAASQAQAGVQDNFNAAQAGSPTAIDIANRTGRYVRVQLEGAEFLHLAEVEVFAVSSGSQAVTFAPGETTKTVTVNVVGDTKVESDETFTVTVTDNSSTPQTLDTGTGTITNDDAASICVPAPPNQVAWYRGENNANDSVGTNNGTNNGVTFSPGKVGQAFTFNGTTTQNIAVPDSISLNATTGTWEFWFKNAQAGNRPGIVGKTDNGNQNGILFFVEPADGKLSVAVNASGGIKLSTPTAVTDGVWHHAAVTFAQNGSSILYLDGQQVAAGVTPAFNFAANSQLLIGRVHDSFWDQFRGQFDEFDIYNRVLSPSEIAAIYNAGSAGKCAGGGSSGCVRADYQFQNTLASSIGNAPAISYIGTGQNFTTDTINGVSRTVLSFPAGSGVEVRPTTGVIANNEYEIYVHFKTSDAFSWNRIVDFKDGSDDGGREYDEEAPLEERLRTDNVKHLKRRPRRVLEWTTVEPNPATRSG